jgi:CSLREA domain-containing protein
MRRWITVAAAFLFLLVGAGLALISVSPAPAGGATFVVTKTGDTADGACDADCSLREAIIAANALPGPNRVELAAGTYDLEIAAAPFGGFADEAAGDLDITDSLVLSGAGADFTIIDANAIDRVIEIRDFNGGVGVLITGVTIRGGQTFSSGGGIEIDLEEVSSVAVQESVLTDNEASSGGGLNATNEVGDAAVEIGNTRISANHATGYAGGVNADIETGSVFMTGSSVSGNVADEYAGGVHNDGEHMDIRSSSINDNESLGYSGGVQNEEGHLSITDSLIAQNTAMQYAAGAMNNQEGTLNITRSLVAENDAQQYGGGVMNNGNGTINIVNSTISSNETSDDGGAGIYQNGPGPINVASSTIAQNAADAGTGGGIHTNDEGPITLLSTIVADNFPADCFFSEPTEELNDPMFSLDSDGSCDLGPGGNKSGQDPSLGPLADNGGPTSTHALQPGSPAIDEGSSDDCPTTDQRGFARPAGSGCDMGAFEAGATAPTPSASPSPTPTPTGGSQQVAWGDHNCSGSADPVDALLNLRHDAGLPAETNECPEMGATASVDGTDRIWGDLDCSGSADPVDGLKVLRFDAGLEVQRPAGCPDPGETVTLNDG